jgi:adenine-specific DNA-methyltransferase
MQPLRDELKTTLQQDERLVIDGNLAKNKIVELALKLDKGLLKLLLGNDRLKEHFFQDVDDTYVFDKQTFQKFISNKEFLPDSYTAFKNKIGLSADGENYFVKSNDVSLIWPYKDCVLEGGQTKEDSKRNEIFWNETLAPDQIDRLLDPKAFTNFKKFDEDGEQDVNDFSIEDNYVIKGNNLLALHSLKKVFAGRVKLIYIDPPYNTGNDSFGYNDSFNQSTWLTFMKNRLEAAYQLLSNDGSIFIQLDYNQLHYCKILMDEVFGKENFRNEIVWQRTTNTGSSKGMAQKLSNDTDSILYYTKSKNNLFNKQYKPYSDDYLKRFKYEDKRGKYRWQYMATYSDQKLKELQKKDMIRWKNKDKNPEYKQYLHELKGIPLNNLWTDIFHINPMAKENVGFKTQKPEKLLARIIKIASNEGDLVMDFFMGSATTCSVAHKLNRQYLGIEQLDYAEEMSVNRLKDTVTGKDIGTLEEVEWRGGGSFVYGELMEFNAAFVSQIEDADSKDALHTIWQRMQENAFLSYKVDPKTINEEKETFDAFSLNEQKQFLVEMLDKNQLYVNYSEIEDEDYGISEDGQKQNHQFYKLK